jgi:hypothetical protein
MSKAKHGQKVHGPRYIQQIVLPYTSGAIWLLNPSLAFKASTNPADISAQAAVTLHQTEEQEESADTTFMET